MPQNSSSLSHARLLQLASAALPVGAFTYSQGLEWAVEQHWVNAEESLHAWLANQLQTSIASLEAPLFIRMVDALERGDFDAYADWVGYLVASRETAELRAEEAQRGRAMARLLPQLELNISVEENLVLKQSQLAGFAWATFHWRIASREALLAWLFSWIENSVLAGVKLIPLGQTQGQQIIFSLCNDLNSVITDAEHIPDDELGFSCTAQVMASSMHESQYTRLYRS
ncbi:MAG: urease accessory protein UreF [Granulosicoccus sp.]|nr:urease accessory protein UreF [Granulosicoccus sp.]